MSTYKCDQCGMSVKTSCGECDMPLVNGMLDLDDGSQVQISQCHETSVQILMEKLNLRFVVGMI